MFTNSQLTEIFSRPELEGLSLEKQTEIISGIEKALEKEKENQNDGTY